MTHANSFDVLRLLAALLVVYGHAYPLTGLVSPHFAGNSVQSIGVKIFFVISGYLILGSWQRDPSVWRFLQRRALRILPGLFVVVALAALVIGPWVSDQPLREYFGSSRVWGYIVNNFMMRPQYDLPGVFLTNPYPGAVNGSLWSLPAEVAMYVIGPAACAVGVVLLRSARWGVLCGAVVLAGLSLWFVRIAPPATVPVIHGSSVLSFLDVAPYFLLGGLYKLFGWDRNLSPTLAGAAWVALSLVQLPGLGPELALYIVLPYTVLALGLQATRAGARLHRFGDISYGVYLYGFPIQQCVAMMLPAGRSDAWLNALITVPPLLVVATLSWRFVERPLLRLKASTPRTSSNSHQPIAL